MILPLLFFLLLRCLRCRAAAAAAGGGGAGRDGPWRLRRRRLCACLCVSFQRRLAHSLPNSPRQMSPRPERWPARTHSSSAAALLGLKPPSSSMDVIVSVVG